MSRLLMNFSEHQGSGWPFKVMLLAGLLGSLVALWERDGLLTRIEMQQAELRRLDDSQGRLERGLSTAVREGPKAKIESQRLVAELQQPWEAMLDELQKAARDDVLITHLQSDAVVGRMLVSGQAGSSEAFLAFAERLRRDSSGYAVEPLSQEPSKDLAGIDGKPIGFQMALQWRSM